MDKQTARELRLQQLRDQMRACNDALEAEGEDPATYRKNKEYYDTLREQAKVIERQLNWNK